MVEQRQYGNPDFGEEKSKSIIPSNVAAPKQETNTSDNNTNEVVISAAPSSSTTKETMDQRAFLKDATPSRQYHQPEFEDTTTTKEESVKPKDIYQSAVMYKSPTSGSSIGGNLRKDDDHIFIWEPTPPTSGVGAKEIDYTSRAFGPAVKDFLAAQGQTSQEYLKPKYDAAYSKVMEGYGMPVYPMNPTIESIQKYNQDMANYNARLQSADAAGVEAVNQEKAKTSELAEKWAKGIAEENMKIIGRDGQGLFDPSKRGAANALLNNDIQISAVNRGLSKATTLPEIMAQIPSLAYSAGVARNPESQPTEFAIQETKGIVDAVLPMADSKLKEQAIAAFLPWMIGHMAGKDVGPNPLEILIQKTEYNNPELIKQRMMDYMREVGAMNNQSKRNYIKSSKDVEYPPPEAYKPKEVSDEDFRDPQSPNKVDAIFGSLIRWNKATSLSPEEVRLGITDPNKSARGENEGVVAFQSYLKNKLGASNYKVTGIPSEDDHAALQILLKQNPSMSAKDVMTEALSHKVQLDADNAIVIKKLKKDNIPAHLTTSKKGRSL